MKRRSKKWKVLRALSGRQRSALDRPVPVGEDVTKFAGHRSVQVVDGSEFHTRTVFVMAGSPGLLGPCWLAEVTVRRGAVAQVVSDWTPAEQESAKHLAVKALKGAGFGENVDVEVTDAALCIWRLAKVSEAQIADARMAARAGLIAPTTEAEMDGVLDKAITAGAEGIRKLGDVLTPGSSS